jgi:hypothetical protein
VQCGTVCAGWGEREQRKVAFLERREIKPADWLPVWGKECVGLRGVQYGGDVHAGVGRWVRRSD